MCKCITSKVKSQKFVFDVKKYLTSKITALNIFQLYVISVTRKHAVDRYTDRWTDSSYTYIVYSTIIISLLTKSTMYELRMD